MRLLFARSLMLGLMLVGMAGCRVPERTDQALTVTERPEPVVVGASIGLEVRRVVVESAGGRIGLALGPHADRATGIDPSMMGRLRAAGLRAVAVPVDQLEMTLGSLRTIGTMQQEWLGQLHFWTPLLVGPTLNERYTTVEGGIVELDPGRLRLMARAYLVPRTHDAPEGAQVDAALRVELMPQHEQAERRYFSSIIEPRTRTFQDDGLLFHRLRFTVDLVGSHALVIVPEDPRFDWEQLNTAANSPAPTRDTMTGPTDLPPDQTPDPAPIHPTVTTTPGLSRLAGPEEPAPRSLGEQMLRLPTQTDIRDSGSVSVRQERSVVLVLIPHTPRHYRLLP